MLVNPVRFVLSRRSRAMRNLPAKSLAASPVNAATPRPAIHGRNFQVTAPDHPAAARTRFAGEAGSSPNGDKKGVSP
ncbi:MAG: hypothetical protein EYR95_19015, partial [Phormidium sp. SL48-SHIP]